MTSEVDIRLNQRRWLSEKFHIKWLFSEKQHDVGSYLSLDRCQRTAHLQPLFNETMQWWYYNHVQWTEIMRISIIAQVIIEKRALWLVEDYVIFCYNHPTRGDYNTEAVILKMATAQFLMFLEKRKKKMHLLW